MWDSPFVSVGPDGAHPLAATYGLIVATFFGAIGLPHILVRFYTNRDGVAARRTTLIVLFLLSTFYLFPAVLGVLGRLRAPQLYLTGSTDGIVLALPRLLLPGAARRGARPRWSRRAPSPRSCPPRPGCWSASRARSRMTCSRAACAPSAGARWRPARSRSRRPCWWRTSRPAFLVGWAFAIAASSFCPLLVLGIWWRDLTWRGALAGALIGGGGCCAAIGATMAGLARTGWAAVLLGYPAIWTVPISFGVMIVVSLATRRDRPGRRRISCCCGCTCRRRCTSGCGVRPRSPPTASARSRSASRNRARAASLAAPAGAAVRAREGEVLAVFAGAANSRTLGSGTPNPLSLTASRRSPGASWQACRQCQACQPFRFAPDAHGVTRAAAPCTRS